MKDGSTLNTLPISTMRQGVLHKMQGTESIDREQLYPHQPLV